jgi:hypothetical protein
MESPLFACDTLLIALLRSFGAILLASEDNNALEIP